MSADKLANGNVVTSGRRVHAADGEMFCVVGPMNKHGMSWQSGRSPCCVPQLCCATACSQAVLTCGSAPYTACEQAVAHCPEIIQGWGEMRAVAATGPLICSEPCPWCQQHPNSACAASMTAVRLDARMCITVIVTALRAGVNVRVASCRSADTPQEPPRRCVNRASSRRRRGSLGRRSAAPSAG